MVSMVVWIVLQIHHYNDSRSVVFVSVLSNPKKQKYLTVICKGQAEY